MPPMSTRVAAETTAAAANTAPASERRWQPAWLDMGHGDADDAPFEVDQVRDDVAAEDRASGSVPAR